METESTEFDFDGDTDLENDLEGFGSGSDVNADLLGALSEDEEPTDETPEAPSAPEPLTDAQREEIFAQQRELEGLKAANPVAAATAWNEMDGGLRDQLHDLFGQSGPYSHPEKDDWQPSPIGGPNRERELADSVQTLARYRDGLAHSAPWVDETTFERLSQALDDIDTRLVGTERDDLIMRTARTLSLATLHGKGARPFGRVVGYDSFQDSRGRLHHLEYGESGQKRERVWSRAETDALLAAQDKRHAEQKALGVTFDPSPALRDALAGLKDGDLDLEAIAKISDPAEMKAFWRTMGPERQKQLLKKASGSRG